MGRDDTSLRREWQTRGRRIVFAVVSQVVQPFALDFIRAAVWSVRANEMERESDQI